MPGFDEAVTKLRWLLLGRKKMHEMRTIAINDPVAWASDGQ